MIFFKLAQGWDFPVFRPYEKIIKFYTYINARIFKHQTTYRIAYFSYFSKKYYLDEIESDKTRVLDQHPF